VEEYKGTAFSVKPLMYLETEPSETPPLFFGHCIMIDHGKLVCENVNWKEFNNELL
jgi:hypothetical protein